MISQDRLTTSATDQAEVQFEQRVRPAVFSHFIGQQKVCEQMELFVTAAKQRKEALDHCLFFGPPGLGKTTLASIIANEMGVQLHSTSGPVIEKAGDVAAQLTNLEPGDVLFIDEIHRLSPTIEEVLYPALEDFQLDLLVGEGPAARSIKIDLPNFTLIGATTRAGMLTSPLRDRFGIIQRLEYYSNAQLASIVDRSARILKIDTQPDGAKQIAMRSRGTPRIANRLLRRVRDYAQVKSNGIITETLAKAAVEMLNINDDGLDPLDRSYLTALTRNFDGKPTGLKTISISLSEDQGTLEDVVEPYLIQRGYVRRTAQGRVATSKAYKYLGLDKQADVSDLFGNE